MKKLPEEKKTENKNTVKKTQPKKKPLHENFMVKYNNKEFCSNENGKIQYIRDLNKIFIEAENKEIINFTCSSSKQISKKSLKNLQSLLSLASGKTSPESLKLGKLLTLCKVTKKLECTSALNDCIQEIGKKITPESINEFVLKPDQKNTVFKIEKYFRKNKLKSPLQNLLIKKFPKEMQYLWTTNKPIEFSKKVTLDFHKLQNNTLLMIKHKYEENRTSLDPYSSGDNTKSLRGFQLHPVRDHILLFEEDNFACIGASENITHVNLLSFVPRKNTNLKRNGVWIPQKLNKKHIIMLCPQTGVVEVLNRKTGKTICSFKHYLSNELLHIGNGTFVTLHSDKHPFATVWNPETGEKHCILKHEGISSVHGPTTNGSLVTFSRNNGIIKGWNVRTGAEKFTKRFVEKMGIVVAPIDGNIFITNVDSCVAVKVWDAQTGNLNYKIENPEKYLTCQIRDSGKVIFTSGKKPTKIIDCLKQKTFHSKSGLVYNICKIDGRTLVLEGGERSSGDAIIEFITPKNEISTYRSIDSSLLYRTKEQAGYEGTKNYDITSPRNKSKLTFWHNKLKTKDTIYSWPTFSSRKREVPGGHNGQETVKVINIINPKTFTIKSLLRYLFFMQNKETITIDTNENIQHAFNRLKKPVRTILDREKKVELQKEDRKSLDIIK